MLTPVEDDDWVYQRGPSTTSSPILPSPRQPSSSRSTNNMPLSKRRYEANLNYRIAFCENNIVIRHGGNLDVALVISRDKIGEGKEMEIVDQGITSSSHCGPIIQEITACALLGTIVVSSGNAFLVLVSDAIPISKLPGGHVVMEITKVSCIPYDPRLSDSTTLLATPAIPQDSTSSSSSSSSSSSNASTAAAFALAERVEKLFGSGGYYYCRSYDITHSQQWHHDDDSRTDDNAVWLKADALFCWNRHMTQNMLGKDALIPNHNINLDTWCTVLMQGYISSPTPLSDYLDAILIGRRSCLRAGTRYNHRGLDDLGDVANFVETELLLCNRDVVLAAHIQIRGSVPVFWSQNPGTQQLDITRSKEMTVLGYDKHISSLIKRYGPDGCLFLNLLSTGKGGNEGKLSTALKDIINYSPHTHSSTIHIIDYDFSRMVKSNNDVDEVFNAIIQSCKEWIDKYGWWAIGGNKGKNGSSNSRIQTGVVRTNCLDCLDRTNAGQLAVSLYIVPKILTAIRQPVSTDVKKVITTLWAQHGDQISMHYTGTVSVLTTLVTQGKCTWQNKVKQKVKSANRYRINNFGTDRDRQTAIDLTLKLARSTPTINTTTSSNIHQQQQPPTERIHLGPSSSSGDGIDTRPITLWVGSWNVNASKVWNGEDLSDWMRLRKDDEQFFEINDIYVVGMQEFVDLNAKALLKRGFARVKKKFDSDNTEHSLRKAEFAAQFNEILTTAQLASSNGGDRRDKKRKAEKYVEVCCTAMVGIYISVFAKASIVNNISNVHTKKVKGGLGGSHGNKGGILMSMLINKTLITFTCLQLEAGERMMEIRNEQLYLIMAEYKQQLRQHYSNCQVQRRVLIVFGDFNFRLNCDRTTAIRLIEKGDIERLSQYDQYRQGECLDPILTHCKEGPFSDFLPTYKFEPGTHQYAANRTPSWCDRIFFNFTKPGSLWLRSYHSHHRYISSDHKPISGTFTLETGSLIIDTMQQQQSRDDNQKEAHHEGRDVSIPPHSHQQQPRRAPTTIDLLL